MSQRNSFREMRSPRKVAFVRQDSANVCNSHASEPKNDKRSTSVVDTRCHQCHHMASANRNHRDLTGMNVTLHPTNAIRSSHYTWWNFIPLFLFRNLILQMTNLYFLVIGFLQMIPSISPTNGIPLQFLPLFIVSLIDGIFAAVEDRSRHICDAETNDTPCRRYNFDTCVFDWVAWKEVQVGDLICLVDKEVAPADLIIVSTVSSAENGTRNIKSKCSF
jgi:magnesium-transporting ATPase (P-type)